jgi:nucleolar protein 15
MAPKNQAAPSSKKASSKVASSAKKMKALISKVDSAPVVSKTKVEKVVKAKSALATTEKTKKITKVKSQEKIQFKEKSGAKTKTGGSMKRPAPVDVSSDHTDEGNEEDLEDDEAGDFKGLSMEDSSDEAASDGDEEEGGVDKDYLKGFSDDGEDSSDDDDDEGVDSAPIDLGKLPTIAKDDETVKRKLDKAKKNGNPDGEKGVISISRLPHGFYEDQLRAYFSQFGDVSRLRVARNKKTGASKHYAFLEFPSPEIATIVAETMNNYLIHGHILQCSVVPKDKIHPDLWIGANRKWRVVPRDRIVRGEHNKPRTEEGRAKASKRLLKRQAQKKRKLEEVGITYDFTKVSYKKPRAVAAV